MKCNVRVVLNPLLNNSVPFKEFVNSVPSIFEDEGTVIFDGRNIIKRFVFKIDENTGKEIIVKKYKRPDLLKKIGYGFFKSSKAERAFFNATELRNRGINTPEELAFLEERKKGFLKSAYFLSSADYSPSIESKFNSNKEFDKRIAKYFAYFVAELHIKGIIHKDLNCSNVLFNENKEGDISFSLIDINRMKFYSLSEKIPLNVCFQNLTLFTGDLKLHRYIIEKYIEYRELNNQESLLQKAIEIKLQHDLRWTRRKNFTRKLKKLFKR